MSPSLLLRALRNVSERTAFSRLLSLATSAPLSALRSCKEFLHFRFDQNVIYLVFSGFTRQGPSRLVDISMLKQGTSYDHVVFITEVTQPFSFVIDRSYTMLPHHTVPGLPAP